MNDYEYSLRSAIGADAEKITALVNAAYEHYVEQIGMVPRPMTRHRSSISFASRPSLAGTVPDVRIRIKRANRSSLSASRAANASS